MALTFRTDPPVTPALRAGIVRLWVDVSNAGGAVGFVPPATSAQIRPSLDKLLAIDEGTTRILVGQHETDPPDEPSAAAFFTFNTLLTLAHWVWVKVVMVHPQHQGKGYGYDLMTAAADFAGTFDGIEAIRLDCRGGMGLEQFYARLGYKEVGRVPGAIRVSDDDYRDDVTMVLPLTRSA
jgi:GNAT superfamily N-acetyltransferase